MPSAFELLEQNQPQPAADVPVEQPGAFSQGLRQGADLFGANIQNFAGGAGEALGFDQFARDRYAAAKQAQDEAAAEAPRVQSFRDVHGLGDAYDYLAGQAGAMIPAAGAAVLGGLAGRTPVGRAVGAAAALLPNEAGDVIGRQQAGGDTGTATDRFGRALVSGGASALAQSIPGAGVAGKVAGELEAQGAGQALRQGLRGMPQAVGLNAGLGAGSEAVKEVGAGQETDPNAIEEAAVGGGVMGGALHGVGAVAEAARAGAKSPANVLSGGVDAIKNAAASGVQAAKDKIAGTPDAARAAVDSASQVNAPDPVEALKGIYDQGQQKARAFWDAVKNGDDTANLMAKAGATADQIKAALPQLDAERVQKVKDWADNTLAKGGLTPERRQWLADQVANVSDQASQQAIAAFKAGMETTGKVRDAVSQLWNDYRQGGSEEAAGEGAKKSEDFSGIREQLAQKVLPAMQEANPDILHDDNLLAQAGDAVRQVVSQIRSGGLEGVRDGTVQRLRTIFGDGAENVLHSVYSLMHSDAVGGEESNRFYGALQELQAQRPEKDKLFGLMQRSVLPELQDSVRTSDVKQELDTLRAWMQHTDLNSAKAQFDLQRIRSELESRYGKSADKILTQLEKERPQEENILGHEDAANLTEKDVAAKAARTEYAPTTGDLYKEPGFERESNASAGRPPEHDATNQALARAQKENPDRSVRFVSAKDLGAEHPKVDNAIKRRQAYLVNEGIDPKRAAKQAKDEILSGKYGVVAAEGEREPGYVSKDNIAQVRIKDNAPRSHYDQPSVFKADGKAFDAIALTKLMEKQHKGEYTAEDDKSAVHRSGRMFLTGVAALQDHLGKTFEVPDHTVIDHAGTTVGDLKKLDFTPPDRYHGALSAHLDALRRQYREEQDPEKRARIQQQAQDLIDRAKSFDPRMESKDLTKEEGGSQEPDPFGNVHEALKGQDNPDAVIRTNLTGNSREKDQGLGGALPKDEETAAKSGPVKGTSDVLRQKLEAWQDKPPSAGAKEIARKGLALLDNKELLNGSAKKDLAALLSPNVKASRVGEVVNSLWDRYGKKIEGAATKAEEPAAKAEPKAEAPASKYDVDSMIRKEDYSKLETNADTDTFLKEAAQRWVHLEKQLRDIERQDLANDTDEADKFWDQHRGMFSRLREMFESGSHADLSSFYPDFGTDKVPSDTEVRAMIRKAVPEVAAYDPKFSKVSADATAKALKDRAEELTNLASEIEDRAGEIVQRALKAGENTPEAAAIMKEYGPLQEAANTLYSAARKIKGEAETRGDYERGMERPNLTPQKLEFLRTIREQIDDVVTEQEARAAKALEDAGYKPSMQATGVGNLGAKDMQEVRDYVDRVLGPSVKTALANIPHAGEYVNDTIRISVHALNPMSVAYHEALHGFFDKLVKQGNEGVGQVLSKAAMSAPIQNQLKRLLAHEPAALAQLREPEEAAAYMYQFWAAGQLKVGDQAKTVFGKIKAAIAKVLGIWTNDQRAQAILDYFHSGEFRQHGMGQPNAVARALLESHRSAVLERAKALTKPLVDVADALSTAGGQRLRDTGVPALRELADLMKATGRDATDDAGFVPAARVERTKVMNDLGEALRPFKQEHLDDALQAMQSGGTASTPEGRLAQRAVQKLLADQLEYMRKAGVDVSKIQPREDYFPRLYDAHYISRHQDEFITVLEKHGMATKDARGVMANLMATNGAEFTVETDRPGMQNLKLRKLGDIPDSELAPFMRKNLYEILGSYVTQATRRAEWARRFGDDGKGISDLLARAKVQGATDAQVDTARSFVRAVDGTLGDTLSPTARRIMGNAIVYQNLRLLPMAIFSSVVDPLGIVVRGGTVRDAWSTFKRGVREIPTSFKHDFKADGETELAQTLGVIDHAVLSDATGQLYTQGLVGDGVKKLNDAFFKYNLMEGFNRSMRVGATQAAIRFLTRHADGTASEHSVRWLSELGLKPGEFDPTLKNPKTVAAINQWVDGAVLRPDAVDKPLWMSDPHWMLISHLKQFVYAFQETILKRVLHEYREGNYKPAMALTAYVPVMIASDAIKGMVQGMGSQPAYKDDWGPEDYLGSGIERAGLLGKLQFPVDGPGMMLGPTAQQAISLAEALDGKGPAGLGQQAVKALPGEALYASWLDSAGKGGGTQTASSARVENNMAVD